MKRLAAMLAIIAIAVTVGLGSAWLLVGEGLLMKSVVSGEWAAWPGAGQAHPDPYSRAVIARTGQVPLATGEAATFYASTDASGATLRGSCDYALTGAMPDARVWTLTVVDAAGRQVPVASGRHFITSRDVVRMSDRPTQIMLARNARPGNWLPTATDGRLTVILRLYDPPPAVPIEKMKLPSLSLVRCT